MPTVSVLMPCRNAVPYLERAAQSITAQSFTDFEVVAVDDGSTDGTRRQLHEWAKRDPRVRVIGRRPSGIVSSLMTAAAAATGSILARMDADDVSHPNRFERQLELLRSHPDLAACGTRIRYFPRQVLRDGARRYERWINEVLSPGDIRRDLFVECPIPHPTLMVRRQAWDAVAGYRDAGWPEDYDLVLRLDAAGFAMAKTSEILLDWRERPDRLSRTDPRYGPDAFRRCKASHLVASRLAGRPVVVWGAGPIGKAFARSLADAGGRLAGFIDLDPRKIGQTIQGVAVRDPSGVASLEGCYAVAAVGATEARAEIRAALTAAGWAEPADFCAVA